MKYGNYSNVFGVEKEYGKLNGILAAIYQYVFGTELYPSIEEKSCKPILLFNQRSSFCGWLQTYWCIHILGISK